MRAVSPQEARLAVSIILPAPVFLMRLKEAGVPTDCEAALQAKSNVEIDEFVPILTVFPDYGPAPFLWIVRSLSEGGVGSNLCDGFGWDESFPLSEGLWRKFVDWCDEYEREEFYCDELAAACWDWTVFHTRGLQLSCWLKEEVGDTYRVVYYKPCEDPNHQVDERTEILVNGGVKSLQPLRSSFS